LIPFVRNTKRSLCISSKTSDCLSRTCLNNRYTVLSYRSLNCMSLRLLFFADFLMVRALIEKKLPD